MAAIREEVENVAETTTATLGPATTSSRDAVMTTATIGPMATVRREEVETAATSMLGGERAHATAGAVEQGMRRTTGGRTGGEKQPTAPKAAPISKVAKSKSTVDKRGTKRGQSSSAIRSRKATTSRTEERTGEYDAWMNELSSDEGSDDDPPSTRLRAMSIDEEPGRDEPPTKKMRRLVIDEEAQDNIARSRRAAAPVTTTAPVAVMLSGRTLDEDAEDRLSKSIASAMQSARMTIPERPTFDGEGDVERYIDEARLYIEQFPNEDSERKVLRLSTGLNGPLRDTIWRNFDRKAGPEAFFRALSAACCKREMPPGNKLHNIKMRPNEPCALFAERLKSLARRFITDEARLDEYCLALFTEGARHGVRKRLDCMKPKTLSEAVACGQDAEEEWDKKPDSSQRTADNLNSLTSASRHNVQPQHEQQPPQTQTQHKHAPPQHSYQPAQLPNAHQQQRSVWQQQPVEQTQQQASSNGAVEMLKDDELRALRELLRDSGRQRQWNVGERRRIRCYICNEEGHPWRRCPTATDTDLRRCELQWNGGRGARAGSLYRPTQSTTMSSNSNVAPGQSHQSSQ